MSETNEENTDNNAIPPTLGAGAQVVVEGNGSSGRNGEVTIGSENDESQREDENNSSSEMPEKKGKKRSHKSSKRKRHSHSKKRRRRKRYSSSSSDSSSSASSYSEEEDKRPETKRFKVVSEEDRFKYSLPPSMASYVNENFEVYVPDKELKAQILLENPVPENVDPVKKLDDFAKSILKDSKNAKATNEVVNMDKTLEKIQNKIRDVMGPLSRIWGMTESATQDKDYTVSMSLDDLQMFTEQTVLLLGQCSNLVSYHRRYNLLSQLMDSTTQAKELLREKATLLQKHEVDLLGKKFTDHIVELTKSKKNTIEAFSGQKNKRRNNKPFPGPLQSSHQGRSTTAERQVFLPRSKNTGGYKQHQQRWQNNYGRGNYQQGGSRWHRNSGRYGS